MVVKIDPIILSGNWDLGFALDYHTVKSVYLGEDPYGKLHFDNTYTPIGELLNKLKYRGRLDAVEDIVDTAAAFIKDEPRFSEIVSVLPVPPTNKHRLYQPVFEIAELLAEKLDANYNNEVLEKVSTEEFKNLSVEEKKAMHGTIIQRKSAKYKHNVLLIDDVYKTGSTLKECTEVLRKDPNINKIFVLTITITRT